MRTQVLRLCGQCSTKPSEVRPQSTWAMSSPSSPPPLNNASGIFGCQSLPERPSGLLNDAFAASNFKLHSLGIQMRTNSSTLHSVNELAFSQRTLKEAVRVYGLGQRMPNFSFSVASRPSRAVLRTGLPHTTAAASPPFDAALAPKKYLDSTEACGIVSNRSIAVTVAVLLPALF